MSIGQTPNPKDLFSDKIFNVMGVIYMGGFLLFGIGIYFADIFLLKLATVFLLLTALLYNWNVVKLVLHKPGKL